jgi:hypothetical protein
MAEMLEEIFKMAMNGNEWEKTYTKCRLLTPLRISFGALKCSA